MVTVVINDKSRIGRRLLKDIKKHPRIARVVDDSDDTPLPIPIEETISLEEFKEHFEKRIYEDLGLKIDLGKKYRETMNKQGREVIDKQLHELRNS